MGGSADQIRFQDAILEAIFQRFTKHSEAISDISKVLDLTVNAIYRRVRGETILSPDEIKILALHYNISLDGLLVDDQTYVPFNYFPLIKPIKSILDYLENMRDDLLKITSLPDAMLYYASAEIPIFYYAYFPELMSFKLYVWAITVWKLDYLKDRKFESNLLTSKEKMLIEEILAIYRKMPSIEFWSLNIFDNTLNQIEYFAYMNGFVDPETPLQLSLAAEKLVAHLREVAKSGHKLLLGDTGDSGSAFELYHNEMIFTNNTVFVKNPLKDIVFSSYCNPNFISTEHSGITAHCFEWFMDIKDKSTLLSHNSSRHRDRFFDSLARKTKSSINRITQIAEELKQD
ncbi:MAG: helix-turn-helix transcriptional regulator [Saprospiraceae bacterium]